MFSTIMKYAETEHGPGLCSKCGQNKKALFTTYYCDCTNSSGASPDFSKNSPASNIARYGMDVKMTFIDDPEDDDVPFLKVSSQLGRALAKKTIDTVSDTMSTTPVFPENNITTFVPLVRKICKSKECSLCYPNPYSV